VTALRIGLLDGALPAGTPGCVAARSFLAAPSSGEPGRASHAAEVLALIRAAAPGIEVCSAEVLAAGRPTPARAVAAGLDWLLGLEVALVNLSLGLRRDRAALAEACTRAGSAGCLLVAAAPAHGPPVYPAAYPGVIAVTGDARCAPGELSLAPSAQADFGACPRPARAAGAAPLAGGASLATARVSGVLAAWLAAGGDPARAREHLAARARHRTAQRPG